jgi:hypothetical protein
MKYDKTIERIQATCKNITRGDYVYAILPKVTEEGEFICNALYRVNKYETSYVVDWQWLRDL